MGKSSENYYYFQKKYIVTGIYGLPSLLGHSNITKTGYLKGFFGYFSRNVC